MTKKADEKSIKTIDTVAKLLDSQFKIPGTDIRFGLDSIIGFFPVVGDFSGLIASGALVLTMIKHGASGKVVMKMLGNIALDSLLGAIPVLGDIFDLTFKANNRNVKLLKEHYQDGEHQGNVWLLFLAALLILIGIGALLVWVLWNITSSIWGLVFS